MFLYGLAQSVGCECFECFLPLPLAVCGVESINLYILLELRHECDYYEG